MQDCGHSILRLEPSEHATGVGYKAPAQQQLSAAAQATRRAPKKPKTTEETRLGTYDSATFPAPLVLPGDELSWDPEYESQTLKDWIEEPERNEVTQARRTIYVVPTPRIRKNFNDVRGWIMPVQDPAGALSRRGGNGALDACASPPKIEDVADYLKAFYYGLPVKVLTEPKLEHIPRDEPSRSKAVPSRISLKIGSEVIGIRVRPSLDGVFSGQLSLDDLLDAATSILPKDAYALMMLVDHDIYEGEEDDFCCGRAYGGSRVAVVSTARYNPALDDRQQVEREHAWPASHCQSYIDACCAEDEPPAKKSKKKTSGKTAAAPARSSAIRLAVDAFSALHTHSNSEALSTLWLSRVCKTASHEFGHCFGMDHCVFRACIMQGTAGLSEDARQPPYLCPVDLAKVLRATGAEEVGRYRVLLAFCEKFKEDRMFSAFGAWLKVRASESEG